ncbi:flotillin-like FloA family protein [Roseiconus nitratireducens]|nr:flotillin-like FloA family protein [Roseiconus nitratireducens]
MSWDLNQPTVCPVGLLAAVGGPNPIKWGLILFGICLLLVLLGMFLFFVRLFRLWLQAFLANAQISAPELVGMMFRRAPLEQVVRCKIMAAQAGLPLTTAQIESAALQGVDIERAVLAMIRAKQDDLALNWEDVIAEDTERRYRSRSDGS